MTEISRTPSWEEGRKTIYSLWHLNSEPGQFLACLPVEQHQVLALSLGTFGGTQPVGMQFCSGGPEAVAPVPADLEGRGSQRPQRPHPTVGVHRSVVIIVVVSVGVVVRGPPIDA